MLRASGRDCHAVLDNLSSLIHGSWVAGSAMQICVPALGAQFFDMLLACRLKAASSNTSQLSGDRSDLSGDPNKQRALLNFEN